MDVDFLAGGAMLERGAVPIPALPSVPALLRAACGANAEPILGDYALLRRAEASVRWIAGRAVEAIEANQLDVVAELTEPGRSAEAFGSALQQALQRLRKAYQRVVSVGSISALGS